MDGLRGCASDGAYGEGLGRGFRRAVVAFGFAPLDNLDLSIEAGRATLDQRHIGGKAHPVDMSPRIEVVQRIEDEAEALEPRDVELAILDVVVVRNDADVGIELAGRLFRNQCLGLLDVLIAEQELAVEVAEIDGVEVDDVYLAEAGEDEVLEEFAANAASSYHQDA